MCVPELGSIEEVNIRTVWPNEAACFTPWLSDNIGLLSDALGMDLEKGETEKQVRSLSVDILTKNSRGQTVVIENQLEATDHDHLGRLLVYATGCDARIVIWVAAEFKDEHRAAIDWLNARTREQVDFYGVEVRVVKIGDSLRAPDFCLVVRPDAWSRQTGRDASPDNEKQRQFNREILDKLREQGLTDTTRVNLEWNSIPSKVSGFRYYWSMERNRAQTVAVYLEMKTGDQEYEKKVFDSLKSEETDIEASLEGKLKWKERGKIQIMLLGEEAWINDPPERLNEIRDWIIKHLLKLKEVFDPRLEQIDRQSPPEEG